MNPIVKSALLCALLAGLAACGNKGPLVLPEKPAAVEETPVSNAPSSDDPTPPAEGVTPPTQEEQSADEKATEAVQSGNPDGDD
ncbi:MAG: lipoprotein [Pseudoxanthomonas sp.]